MDYMTLKEAAEKWGVTPRRVNYYCRRAYPRPPSQRGIKIQQSLLYF